MLSQIIIEIAKFKWQILVFVLAAVIFCGIIYLTTRDFNWSYKKIRAYSILYNLNLNGLISVALLLSRLCYVLCMVAFVSQTGLWDLIILMLLSIAIVIASKSFKNILQIFTYFAIYLVCLVQNMFIGYYRDIDHDFFILLIAILFGLFAFLFAVYQTLVSYNNLLNKSATTDKKNFDKEFYEKEVESSRV